MVNETGMAIPAIMWLMMGGMGFVLIVGGLLALNRQQGEKRKHDDEKPKRQLTVGDDGELVEISGYEAGEEDHMVRP